MKRLAPMGLALCLFASCSKPVAHREWAAMECNFAATVHGSGSVSADQALDELEVFSHRMDSLLTDYNPRGPLSVLRGRKGDTVSVDPAMASILEEVEEAMPRSHRTLDIGLHDLKALWGIDAPHPEVPTVGAIDSVLARRYPDSVSRDQAPFHVLPGGKVVLRVDSLPVDLGGVAKGWVVDRMSAHLEKRGFPVHLLQAGGEILARGRKSAGAWNIGIKNPRATSSMAGLIRLDSGMAVSTSGDYERFFLKDGIRYHHILDPRTGRPAPGPTASATLLCPTSATCDLWSKTMFLLGPGRADALADSLGIAVLWIRESPRGGLCGTAHGPWGDRLVRDTLPACP